MRASNIRPTKNRRNKAGFTKMIQRSLTRKFQLVVNNAAAQGFYRSINVNGAWYDDIPDPCNRTLRLAQCVYASH